MSASVSATTAHHGLPAHEVVLLLESDPYHGLSDGEAAQRLERFGPNTLAVVTRASLLARILRQFLPAGAGPELEKRFAHRAHAVENSPGFLGFQLLRPVKGEERYFVVTHWESDEAFQAWANGPAIAAHAGHRANPVATGASLLEFEVVLDVGGTGKTA